MSQGTQRYFLMQSDPTLHPSAPMMAGGVTVVRVVVRAGGAVRSDGRLGRFREETLTFGLNRTSTHPPNRWARGRWASGRWASGRWAGACGGRAVRCRCDMRGVAVACGIAVRHGRLGGGARERELGGDDMGDERGCEHPVRLGFAVLEIN